MQPLTWTLLMLVGLLVILLILQARPPQVQSAFPPLSEWQIVDLTHILHLVT